MSRRKEVKVYNPYAILGAHKGMADHEVKLLYMDLARVHHPDRPRGSNERMAEISGAYADIKTDIKRTQFDNLCAFTMIQCEVCAGRGHKSVVIRGQGRVQSACIECEGMGYRPKGAK